MNRLLFLILIMVLRDAGASKNIWSQLGKIDPKENKGVRKEPIWAMGQNVYYTCCTVK